MSDRVDRRDVADTPAIATFREDERGEITCRPTSTGPPPINGVASEARAFRLFFDTARFTVDAPQPDVECVTDDVIDISGQGPRLDEGRAEMVVQVASDGGAARPPTPLVPVGDDRYAARLDISVLPDGEHTLIVSGTAFGGLSVDVFPPHIDVEVDRAPPEVRFIGPVEPFLEDIDPATAGFQVQR